MNTFFQIAALLLQVPVLVVALIIILIQPGVLPSHDLPWIIITLLHLSLFPLLYGAFVYKTKRISNADITERKERVFPFFIITCVYGFYLLITILFDAPEIFRTLATHYFVLALILSLVTVWWKVSVHTAGVAQFVVLLSILIGSQALFLAPLIVFTGWLRITMKSHNLRQVLGGVIVALLSVMIATIINFS
ncbi:MAG: hypothetical protein HYR90_00790 [Candidatus Andersenbacteria bacterium]|nr:hypothetical protein [Candidatus Andersenbacteria bacterium]MBI3251215.1 hypothetical protein [Candidatus Andersenbacteria bacterium]